MLGPKKNWLARPYQNYPQVTPLPPPPPKMGVTATNQQQQNHRLRTDSSLSHWGGGGGVNAFYWYQIFALDSAVVEAQKRLSSHGAY